MREPTEIQRRLLFIIGLIVIVVAVLVVKGQRQGSSPSPEGVKSRSVEVNRSEQPAAENRTSEKQPQPANLPRLIDLGADKCVPCKMMAPILEELKEEYKDQFEVVFIDVWKNPQPGRQYKIRVIPTQIFLDESGKELFRHEGFFSKEDILKKWAELGIEVEEQ